MWRRQSATVTSAGTLIEMLKTWCLPNQIDNISSPSSLSLPIFHVAILPCCHADSMKPVGTIASFSFFSFSSFFFLFLIYSRFISLFSSPRWCIFFPTCVEVWNQFQRISLNRLLSFFQPTWSIHSILSPPYPPPPQKKTRQKIIHNKCINFGNNWLYGSNWFDT